MSVDFQLIKSEMADASAIIREVMAENDVDPARVRSEDPIQPSNLDRIRRSRRYFLTKGFANFPRHEGFCGRTWTSAHAWCVIDLKKQRIYHRYSQECQNCEGEGKPVYDEPAIRQMAEWVCKRYLIRVGLLDDEEEPPSDEDAPTKSSQPHDTARCEMCRLLGGECWQ